MPSRSVIGTAFWLGFDPIEQELERIAKHAADSWPPYNIEQIGSDRLQLTLAVAGFLPSELQIILEQNNLHIHGKKLCESNAKQAGQTTDGQNPDGQQNRQTYRDDTAFDQRIFLHRGIAMRQFRRHFILGHDIKLDQAELSQGLLILSLSRPPPTPPKYVEITLSNNRKLRENTFLSIERLG